MASRTKSAWAENAGLVTHKHWHDNNTDVTLVTLDGKVYCHSVVLAACSPFLRDVLTTSDNQNYYVIVLTDITPKVADIQSLVDFMYKGKLEYVSSTCQLTALIDCAKSLNIRGLKDFSLDESKRGNFTISQHEKPEILLQMLNGK